MRGSSSAGLVAAALAFVCVCDARPVLRPEQQHLDAAERDHELTDAADAAEMPRFSVTHAGGWLDHNDQSFKVDGEYRLTGDIILQWIKRTCEARFVGFERANLLMTKGCHASDRHFNLVVRSGMRDAPKGACHFSCIDCSAIGANERTRPENVDAANACQTFWDERDRVRRAADEAAKDNAYEMSSLSEIQAARASDAASNTGELLRQHHDKIERLTVDVAEATTAGRDVVIAQAALDAATDVTPVLSALAGSTTALAARVRRQTSLAKATFHRGRRPWAVKADIIKPLVDSAASTVDHAEDLLKAARICIRDDPDDARDPDTDSAAGAAASASASSH